jgi:Protein of unknown function (DUF3303)
MKFIVSWTVPQGAYNTAIARFLETGGAPPKSVEMLGRWHGMSSSHGVAIAETTDANALYLWQAQWSDLMPMSISPCLDDAEVGSVLASLSKR